MSITRRKLLATSAAALAGSALLGNLENVVAQDAPAAAPNPATPSAPSAALGDYTPTVSPDVPTLPLKLVNGVKVGHLIAEAFTREFAPGLTVNCWGYNGSSPGPVIEAVEGDRLRIYVTNKLPESTSVHWHGLLLPSGMDGVSGVTQKPIRPGETFMYEFTLRQHGTLMYHPHFDEMLQMGMGMQGMFIIHPRDPRAVPRVDRDYVYMLSEWAIKPGTSTPNTTVMNDFNILTLNSKAFPGTAAMIAKTGERIRIRFGNLSAMDHHPIHIHGVQFKIAGTNGGRIPEAAQWPESTLLVPVGTTRDIEFAADLPGDWPMHCHMTHHVMNQMGHDQPNLLGIKSADLDEKMSALLPDYMTMGQTGMGAHAAHMQHMARPKNSIPMLGKAGPFGYIDMGGMFTLLKVRDNLHGNADPGWYSHPAGTVASQATAEAMKRDGIESK